MSVPETVVLLNDSAHLRGGADQVAFASARGLAETGCRAILIAGMGPVAPELREVPGLEVVCLNEPTALGDANLLRGVSRALWNRKAAKAVTETLRPLDTRRTVVHAHGYTQALSPSVLAAALKSGFRTLLTLHDYFLVCPNGAFFEFPAGRVCHREPLSRDCLTCHCDSRHRAHKVLRVARSWLQKRARIPDRLACAIAISDLNQRRVRPYVPDTVPIHVLSNPVQVPRGEPVAVERNRNYLFSGRLERFKGGELFARAAASRRLPAVFCGTGPAEADWKRLYPTARFTGWLDRSSLADEYGKARALVFPSLWPESYGLVAAEALARGIPVIASRGTAAEEYIRDGENGFLFEQGSAEDLGRKLDLLQDDECAQGRGREAYRRFWDKPPTLDRHIAGLTELYARVLADTPRASDL